jgi:hypothetical protein
LLSLELWNEGKESVVWPVSFSVELAVLQAAVLPCIVFTVLAGSSSLRAPLPHHALEVAAVLIADNVLSRDWWWKGGCCRMGCWPNIRTKKRCPEFIRLVIITK